MGNLLNLHGETIPQSIELEGETVPALRQRMAFISQAEHSLNCMKMEMEMFLKQTHPELQNAQSIAISPDGTKIIYT